MLRTSANLASARPTRPEPFADRAAVGPRGLRTHQRILDAALDAFGASGDHRTSLDRVAELAGCSRVAIYRYVSGEEEPFRLLAAQASNQTWATLESVGDVTPDAAGRASLPSYVARHDGEPMTQIAGKAAVVDGGGSLASRDHAPVEEGRGHVEA